MMSAMAARLDPYLSDLHRSWLAEEDARAWRELDASLLFFDITGFTPLTERLAKRGKDGVELLTELLNAVMDPLLSAAAALGGDTLKFGGDALLLLFAGDGHARRACAAAYDMQRAMQPFRRRPTDAGIVSLRASSAVASGTVQLFLVGDRFRELMIGGPVTSEVMTLEHEARAGEVRLGRATRAALPDGAVRDGATGTLLAARPAVEPVRATPAMSGDPARGLPAALHHHLGPDAESEHRQVATGFAQFRGLDELLARGAPAAAAELEAFMARVQRALDEHGVTFLLTDADRGAGKLFVVTGAPSASAGDEDRLLLAMRDIVAHDGVLRVRAGVSRGRVFVVHLGSVRRRSYTTMGDAVNLAARVMGHAPDGQVLATDAALEYARAPFALTPVAPFAVKGKRVPVRAALVGEPRAAREHEAVDSPLVGREPELRVLREAVRCAREGSGRIVELAGEPGIGKSRLVAELLADPVAGAGLRTVVVESGAYGRSTPYLAVRAPLRRLIAPAPASDEALGAALACTLAEHLPDATAQLALVAIPFGLELPATGAASRLAGELGRAQLHFLVDRLLAKLLPARRTLLVVEDAHWLDEASSDLLKTVLRRAGERGWAVVVTRRPDEGRAETLVDVDERIVLEALDEDAARGLVVAGGGATLAPHVTAALVERSNGNPLFLRELVSAACAGAELDALPTTIEALLATRLDTLMPADRRVLRRAAVLGRSFPQPWLAGMLDSSPDELTAALARLGDFLEVEPGRVRFWHMLQRDAAYEALPFERRRALHARAGELIEGELGVGSDERADVLALHFLRARDHVRAWSYARAAAEYASERYAHADAAVLHGRALEAARGLTLPAPEMSEVYEALGAAHAASGQLERAHDAFTRARRLSGGDVLRESHLMQLHARVAMDAGEVQRAARWLLRGRRALAGDAGPAVAAARARIDSELAGVRARQGRAAEAIVLCERVIAGAVEEGASVAHACHVLDWVLIDTGRTAEAVHSERALAIYRGLGDLDREAAVLNNRGASAYHEGRWADAVRLYRDGAEASTKAGNIGSAAFGDCNLGEVRSDQGRPDEARRHLERALEVWRATGYAWGVAFATTLLGRLEARAGHGALAEAHLRDALGRFRQLHVSPDALWVEALLPEACVFDGRPRDALDDLERLIGVAGTGELAPLLLRVRGVACAQIGRLNEARAALDAAVVAARGRCHEFELFLSLDVLCALDPHDVDGARERDAIAARLDIAAAPPVPFTPPPVVGSASDASPGRGDRPAAGT